MVAYDGATYHGFQFQQGVPTIQGTLEEALHILSGIQIRVTGSGRTDAGVHASGQVIAATIPWRHSLTDLQRAWNANLPNTVAVRKLQVAPVGFHPRFSAISRTYRYTIFESDQPGDWSAPLYSPLTDYFALYVPYALDLTAMQAAANCLIGTYDFATFGQPPQGESTVRNLLQAEWQEVQTDLPLLTRYPGRQLVFTVTANAFLRQMVRNLVGTLLEVGLKRWSVADIKNALNACDRKRCAPPAPPHGLRLACVQYPAHLKLWSE